MRPSLFFDLTKIICSPWNNYVCILLRLQDKKRYIFRIKLYSRPILGFKLYTIYFVSLLFLIDISSNRCLILDFIMWLWWLRPDWSVPFFSWPTTNDGPKCTNWSSLKGWFYHGNAQNNVPVQSGLLSENEVQPQAPTANVTAQVWRGSGLDTADDSCKEHQIRNGYHGSPGLHARFF